MLHSQKARAQAKSFSNNAKFRVMLLLLIVFAVVVVVADVDCVDQYCHTDIKSPHLLLSKVQTTVVC